MSRIGLSRVVFPAYKREEIRTIVRARLEELDTFKSDAIELAAGKVASLSGDIRRALQLCRRAAEIAARRLKESSGDFGMAVGCCLYCCQADVWSILCCHLEKWLHAASM